MALVSGFVGLNSVILGPAIASSTINASTLNPTIAEYGRRFRTIRSSSKTELASGSDDLTLPNNPWPDCASCTVDATAVSFALPRRV